MTLRIESATPGNVEVKVEVKVEIEIEIEDVQMSKKKISKGQIKKLRTLASMQMDDEAYHDWLFDVFHKESTKDLSSWEAHQAIRCLETGTMPKRKSDTPRAPLYRGDNSRGGSYRGESLSKGQLVRIALLQMYLEWDDEALFKFIGKQIKRDNGQPTGLKKAEAVKVVVGLQRVLADSNKKLYAWINKMSNKELQLPENIRVFQMMRLSSSNTSKKSPPVNHGGDLPKMKGAM